MYKFLEETKGKKEMKKNLIKVVSLCMLVLLCILAPDITAKAQDIGLPPAGYKDSGRYPAGKVSNYYYYSNETKSNRKLVVYTPPGFDTSKKYPVVYAIHGIDNTPESIFRSWGADANLIADNLIGSGQIEPVIIVAWDNNNVNCHNELMYNVLPYVEKTFPVIKDADHRAVYGYSMGGGYAFAEVMGNLDTFHHLSPTSALPINHPSDDAMFKKGSKEVTSKLKTLVLSCGTKDWCGFYPANLATHNYCVQYNIPHYWLSVEGGNHDSGVWAPAMYYLLKYAFPKDGTASQPSQPSLPTQPTINADKVVIPDGTYYIKNVNAQKYLTVAENKAAAGTNVEISAFTGNDGQKWTVKNTGDGYMTLTSSLGNFMLDITNGSPEDNANAIIYHGYSGDAQKFVAYSTNTANVCTIATKVSNGTKVLDAYAKGTANGTNIMQWTLNNGTNQQFIFEPVLSNTPENNNSNVPESNETTTPGNNEGAESDSGNTGNTGNSGNTDVSLKADYTINSWGCGYQVNIKITNSKTTAVDGWTLKISKKDVKISTSWNVNIEESGDYYVITPVSWNSTIPSGQSVDFGIQGEGTIGDSISMSVE